MRYIVTVKYSAYKIVRSLARRTGPREGIFEFNDGVPGYPLGVKCTIDFEDNPSVIPYCEPNDILKELINVI